MLNSNGCKLHNFTAVSVKITLKYYQRMNMYKLHSQILFLNFIKTTYSYLIYLFNVLTTSIVHVYITQWNV